MIGKVETINGVKQITPLDDTLIPNISPATPNNSILQYENGVVKSAGYTTSGVVRYMGNFGTMSLSDIYTNYATQNTIIYKGYFDWNDTKNPLYGNGSNTGEVTCFDWCMIFDDVQGRKFYYDNPSNTWVQVAGDNRIYSHMCEPLGGAGYFNPVSPNADNLTDTKYGDRRHHVTGLIILGAGNTIGQGFWLSAIPGQDVYNGNRMWFSLPIGDAGTAIVLVSTAEKPAGSGNYYGQAQIWYGPTLSANTTVAVDFWYNE